MLVIAGCSASGTWAAVLDWSTETYTPGSLLRTFTDVDGSGVDLRITISGNTGFFQNTTPQIVSEYSDDALQLFVDFTSNAQAVTVTFDFFETGTATAKEVTNFSFPVYDIDTDGSGYQWGFIDQLEDVAGSGTNGNFGATFSPQGTQTTANQGNPNALVRAGLFQPTIASDDSAGTVDVSFGSNFGSSYQFVYTNDDRPFFFGDLTQNNPTQQAVGLGDLSFDVPTPIPEPGAILTAALLIATIAIVHLRRNRRTESG